MARSALRTRPETASPPKGRTGRATAMPPEQRRASIIAATRPLLLQHGAAVTTKQIAEAAGIAEGTIFRVFPDKDSLLQAVLAAAFDTAPLEAALDAIDDGLPFERRLVEAVDIMQRRLRDIWQLFAALGLAPRPPSGPPPELAAVGRIFAEHPQRIAYPSRFAAQALRAITLAMTHPLIAPEGPLTATEIVTLFLDGVRHREAGSC